MVAWAPFKAAIRAPGPAIARRILGPLAQLLAGPSAPRTGMQAAPAYTIKLGTHSAFANTNLSSYSEALLCYGETFVQLIKFVKCKVEGLRVS